MMRRHDIGDEIEFYCSKCKLNLRGNVGAMAEGNVQKVTCRTCHFTVDYKPEMSEAERRAKLMKKAFALRGRRRQQKVPQAKILPSSSGSGDLTRRWREQTEELSFTDAVRYDATECYEVRDVVLHREHGLGIVQQVLHEKAMLTLFRKVEVPLEMNAAADGDDGGEN